MSKLEELIEKYCPDGVEYCSMMNIVNTITTGKLNANAMEENGIYPFFTCDANPFKINSYVFRGFNDFLSFDHGDYAVELLNNDMRNYVDTDKYDDLIKVAIKNHNKYKIEDGLTEKELLFSKLVRDADKVDILYQATYRYWEGKEEKINNSLIDQKILDEFFDKKQVEFEHEKTYNELAEVIMTIAFIFDINFKESFQVIKNENYINKILDRFNFKDIDKIREFANNYIDEKIQEA